MRVYKNDVSMAVLLIPVLLSYNFIEDSALLLLTALLILLVAKEVSHAVQYSYSSSLHGIFPGNFPLSSPLAL